MLKVFDKFAEDFSGNGLAVLQEALDVRVRKVINGEWELTFVLPQSEKWQYIRSDNIVLLESQCYRIVGIDGENVTAVPVYKDAIGKHIPAIDDMIGKSPHEILSSLFEGTNINVMSVDDVNALGMEWVDNDTDFFAQSRITPIGGLITLMETLEKYKVHSELYFDNYNIALVKQIGKDRGYKIDLHHNSDNIKPKVDASGIVTRLYPYGKDGLEIKEVNNNKSYIESPNINNFIPHDGFLNFDDITEPTDLRNAALAQFNEENPDRIDVPKYSIEVSCFMQDGTEIQLGDTVTVVDEQYDCTSKQRVVEVDYYPFELHRTTVVVGKPSISLADIIDKAEYYYTKTELNSNERGEIKTGWLEMMQRNESIIINEAIGNQDIALYKTGSLYESPDGDAAVAIINGRVAIANSKTGGQWNWTTIMDAGKVIVNGVYTGVLYTNLVEILSNDGHLNIKDNLITMYDAKNALRFKAGYDGKGQGDGKYCFALYDDNGNETFFVDNDGNLTMRGIFKTGEDGDARVEIDGGGIKTYNKYDELNGVAVTPGEEDDENYSNFCVYSKGIPLFGVSSITVYEKDGNKYKGAAVLAPNKDGDGLCPLLYIAGGTVTLGTDFKWDLTAENPDIVVPNHNHGLKPGKYVMYTDGTADKWMASSSFNTDY